MINKAKLIGLICSFCLISLGTFSCQQTTEQRETNFLEEILGSEADVNISEADVNIILIQHDSCPWAFFWCVLEKGIKDAAKELNVNVTLLRPNRTNFEPTSVKHLVEEALKADPDGIGLTIVKPSLFKELLKEASIKREIPIIAYNASYGLDENEQDDLDYFKEIKVLTYIGANEYQGGYRGGLKLADKLVNKDGQRKGICINHLPKAENLKARCRGFLKAMKERQIQAEILETERNPIQLKQDILKYYENNPNVDIFLTLGPIAATPFYEFIEEVGLESDKFAHGIFDLNKTIVDQIEDGATLFAIDQQPYLQGYMVVQWLTWKIRHQFMPSADRIILTGPSFVDKSNIETVKPQVGQYR